MKLLPPLNPRAVLDHEKYIVCITLPEGSHRIVKSASTMSKALKAMNILQAYDDENGHKSIYWVEERENVHSE